MDLWRPPHDQPHLFEWWRPLLLASRAARTARVSWSIHPDEMVLVGRIDRSGRPDVWVYRHPEARGELYVDGTGQAYKFTRTPNGRSYGRFSATDIRTAVWQAGLPEVVAPVWFDDPWPSGPRQAWDRSPRDDDDRLDPPDDDDGLDAEPVAPAASASPRRHGHLTVHDGGQSLTG